MTRHATAIGLSAAAVVLAADQISKWWVLNGLNLPARPPVHVLGFLSLVMVWNHGVTFGMLNGLGGWSAPVIAVVALAIVVALVLWLRRTTSVLAAIAVGAVAGGAIGNVMDRVRHGAVVDFIRADPWGLFPWVFNVADSAIVCGVIVLLIHSQFAAAPPRPRGPVSGDLPDTPSGL
jgi:lipoprotein signal peptidase